MPKATSNRADRQRHNPLADDLVATGPLRTKPSKRKTRHEGQDEENYVNSKASKKILRMAQELEDENGIKRKSANATEATNRAFDLDSRFINDEDEDDEDVTYNEEEWGDEEEEEVEEMELSPEELRTFKLFNPEQEDPLLRHGWDGPREDIEEERPDTWLADLMLQKIAEKEARDARGGEDGDRMSDAGLDDDFQIPPKVVEVYTKYVYQESLVSIILTFH